MLAVGFVAYGLSIFFYVHAQRKLGAARTGAYYAVAPFIGTILSLAIFRTLPHFTFFIALGIMLVGAWLCTADKPLFIDLVKRIRKKAGKTNPATEEPRTDNGIQTDNNKPPLSDDVSPVKTDNDDNNSL